MNGDQYNEAIIQNIKLLSSVCGQLNLKREVCHQITGGNIKTLNVESQWGEATKNLSKPQYLHSATSIFVLCKYPRLRSTDSFIEIVVRSGIEKECLGIATEVMLADPDGQDFINNSDVLFKLIDISIIDERNQKIAEYDHL